MAAKRKLNLDYEEDFDFLLMGISTFEKDYKFIWLINDRLDMSFSRTEDHCLKDLRNDRIQEFSTFLYRDSDRALTYRIISNRSEAGLLVEEMKNIDFFLLLDGEYDTDYPGLLRDRFASLENVQAVFIIDLAGLKSKERLILC
jgi:hypothetical protein